MRAPVGVFLATLLSLSAVASASEGVPFMLGVTTGVVTDAGPWRAAPAINLIAGIPIGRTRFSFVAGLSGWTFAAQNSIPSASELLASAGVSISGEISQHWTWLTAAEPAFGITQASNTQTGYHAGILISPALEFSTRRRTLGLVMGTQALVLGSSFRLAANAGLVYTFW